MYDDDDSMYYEEMCRGFIVMSDAKDEHEVSAGMRKCFSAIEGIAQTNFARVAREIRGEVSTKVHDSAVIAAGGE